MKKFQDNCLLLFSQKYCDHEGLRKNFNFFLSPNECMMLFSHYFSIYKQVKNTSMFTSGIDKDLQVYQVYRTHACVHVHMRERNPKQKCIFDLRKRSIMPYTDEDEKYILASTFNRLLETGEEEAIVNFPHWDCNGLETLTEYRITVKKTTKTIN